MPERAFDVAFSEVEGIEITVGLCKNILRCGFAGLDGATVALGLDWPPLAGESLKCSLSRADGGLDSLPRVCLSLDPCDDRGELFFL